MYKCAVYRYLVTRNSLISLYYEYTYFFGATTVPETGRDTYNAIWECLKPVYMSTGDINYRTRKADEFYLRTNFLNCIVSVH